jgi:hypothetical protein
VGDTVEGATVEVTGGVTVVVTGAGVGVGVGVGLVGVADGSGRGLLVGRIVGIWTAPAPGPGFATLLGGEAAPEPDPETGTTSAFTVALYCCPGVAGGPAAMSTGPPGVAARVARSCRLPCCTRRPTARTCDGPVVELGEADGRSPTSGVAASEEGPASAILCGGPGGVPGPPPSPM